MPAPPLASQVPGRPTPASSMTPTTTCLLRQKIRGIPGVVVFAYGLRATVISTLKSFSILPVSLHSQKKPQKVSLLFEDEDDDFNGGLFGAQPAASTSAAVPPANVSS